ncbi:EpsI family protein [Janthinobacterium sp. CG_23.3]|uniref:exosortase-associated protein EpsI, B-type n=1 Tax=Janthinobacterium sp. CG_23.3 TaxID=3349634 RepID=UPI0038D3BEA6
MNKASLSSAVLGLLMVASAGTAELIMPTHFLSDSRQAVTLETAMPRSFGGWTEERGGMAAVVNPSTEAALKEIYTQTVSRTYVNRAGYRIMLSLAYGANQSDGLQLHYPEVCYPAQGFEVSSNRNGVLATPRGAIRVKRLETNLSRQRYEAVTYWSTVGDVVVQGGINKKMAEMRYRLGGQIPDGLLFRVSSIDVDSARSFQLQDEFVSELASALPAADKLRLMGLAN